jgi:hypothetical protein
VPSAYVVVSAYGCDSDARAQATSTSQQIIITAKPTFMKIEFEGERSVPFSRRMIPTMIRAIPALIRKWYWKTRNHSSLLFNFGLRARRLRTHVRHMHSTQHLNAGRKEGQTYASWRIPRQPRSNGESPTLERIKVAKLDVVLFFSWMICNMLPTTRTRQNDWMHSQPRMPRFPCLKRM